MQRLSVEQVVILTILNEFDIAEEYQLNKNNKLVEISNKERLENFIEENDWNDIEVDNIVEELQYWKYIDKAYKLTIPGRQYLRTGPEGLEQGNYIGTKQYNFSLFERVVDFNGINTTEASGSGLIKVIGAIADGLKRK